MNDELVYKGDTTQTYAMSMAATWICAPAIFVASSMAYYNGLYGFLWFLIPNVLTLLLFGYFAQYFVSSNSKDSFIGIPDLFVDNRRQSIIHSVVSAILLINSTCIQILGLHALLQIYFPDIYIGLSAIVVSLFCYIYTKCGGIKVCIISDKYKYLITLIICILLIILSCNTIDFSKVTIFGVNNPDFIDISLSFGIISAIGLMGAPYADSTFWQRVFSTDKRNVLKMFCQSGLYFMLVPLCFGIIGFLYTSTGFVEGWEITKAFEGNLLLSGSLSVAVFCVLVATLDSNLCAIHALSKRTMNVSSSMEMLLLLTIIFIITFEPTIVQMFLIYGTTRCAVAIPTMLTICERYDKSRLFYSTIIALVVGVGGFVAMKLLNLPYGYVFTIFAFTFPLLGYSSSLKHK